MARFFHIDGTITETPSKASPRKPAPTISRIRFDAVFAAAIGDLAYETVLDAVEATAKTSPMTEDSAKVRRAWRALESVSTVDYPLGPWRDASLDDPKGDLTGQFLKIVASILTPTVPDIADKIDAGLAAWPEV